MVEADAEAGDEAEPAYVFQEFPKFVHGELCADAAAEAQVLAKHAVAAQPDTGLPSDVEPPDGEEEEGEEEGDEI